VTVITINKNRTCKVCNEYKDISNFQPQGLQCRSCRTAKSKAYWNNLPEDVRIARRKNGDAQRRWVENNPERSKELSRKQHLKRKFGLSVEEYAKMLASQNGVCSLCENSCATGYSLAVDHDHNTGKIRGLLCKNCNTALGLLKENVETMTKAIDYIKFHTLTGEIS
jgi:hypothetical protein